MFVRRALSKISQPKKAKETSNSSLSDGSRARSPESNSPPVVTRSPNSSHFPKQSKKPPRVAAVHVPHEIVLLILLHSRDPESERYDLRLLSTCSLVHRSWTPAGQELLFARLEPASFKAAQKLREVILSSNSQHLGKLVKEIILPSFITSIGQTTSDESTVLVRSSIGGVEWTTYRPELVNPAELYSLLDEVAGHCPNLTKVEASPSNSRASFYARLFGIDLHSGCSNLVSLSCTTSLLHRRQNEGEIGSLSLIPPVTFPHVRELTLIHCATAKVDNDVSSWVKFPSLEKLSFEECMIFWGFRPFLESLETCPKSLHIKSSMRNQAMVVEFLESLPQTVRRIQHLLVETATLLGVVLKDLPLLRTIKLTGYGWDTATIFDFNLPALSSVDFIIISTDKRLQNKPVKDLFMISLANTLKTNSERWDSSVNLCFTWKQRGMWESGSYRVFYFLTDWRKNVQEACSLIEAKTIIEGYTPPAAVRLKQDAYRWSMALQRQLAWEQ